MFARRLRLRRQGESENKLRTGDTQPSSQPIPVQGLYGLPLDYIDSMEGATLSGRRAAAYICGAGEEILSLRRKIAAADEAKGIFKESNTLSLV